MRSLLIISRCFPPAHDVGGKRAYRFAKYLPAYGWNSVIWTTPLPNGHPVDTIPLETLGITIERTFEPEWWPKPYLNYTVSSDAIRSVPRMATRVARACALPLGPDIVLVPRAIAVLRRLIRHGQFDAILATGGPPIALAYGWIAHKLARVPLILDLRDPWSLNYLQSIKPAWVRHVEGRMERALFKGASRVIFTSKTTEDAYRQALPSALESKFVTITNSFDPSLQVDKQSPSGPIRTIHFGHSNGTRTLGVVLRALARLQAEGKWPAVGIELINYGRIRFDDLQLATSLGLGHVFRNHALVGTAEGIEILASADLLLLLSYGQERLYVPAKTFDYLLARRPILCIAQRSCLTEIIEDTGAGLIADPDDVQAVASAIESAIVSRTGQAQFPERRPEKVAQYNALATTRRLAALLDSAIESIGSR